MLKEFLPPMVGEGTEIKQYAQGQATVYEQRMRRGCSFADSTAKLDSPILIRMPAAAAFTVLSTIITLNPVGRQKGRHLIYRLISMFIFLSYI